MSNFILVAQCAVQLAQEIDAIFIVSFWWLAWAWFWTLLASASVLFVRLVWSCGALARVFLIGLVRWSWTLTLILRVLRRAPWPPRFTRAWFAWHIRIRVWLLFLWWRFFSCWRMRLLLRILLLQRRLSPWIIQSLICFLLAWFGSVGSRRTNL